MNGDFSRITFDRSKHYTGVRLQQGRVQLDADWNEQVDIGNYQRHTLAADLIGGSGAPESGGGFEIKADSSRNELRLTAGRYYVDGILCENEAEISLTEQLELPGFALPDQGGRYLAYLDVWERSITALEDENILELALGGADTATRTHTVWQVKLAKFDNNRSTVPADWQPDPRDLPTLIAGAIGGSPQENQLYRIEVHEPARLDSAGNLNPTFKWSRDNASSVALILQNPADNSQENRFQIVIQRQVGPDQGGGFETGQWIEVTDEDRILRGEPGILAKLSSVSGQELSVEGWPDANAQVPNLPNRPTIRRWDSDGASHGERTGDTTTLNLDGSVQVKITGASGSFRTGDYWLVTTRAAEGVQWPLNTAGAPLQAPPRGIRHHYAPLAFVDFNGSRWSSVNSPESVRKIFKGTTAVPGGEKLNRKENDTMKASLVIEGSLTVGRVSPPSTPSKGLALVDGPLVLTQGATPDYGLRFATSGSFLREESNKMTLGAVGSSLALSQGGDERLTLASDGRVGIRIASPEQDVHVGGEVILLEPGTRVEIKRSLAYSHGSRGEGKVLTSDKDGNATWRELPTRQVGAPVFVHRFEVAKSPSTTFPNAAASTGWIRFQLPDVMPTGIRAVILEAQAAKKDPNSGDIDGYIAVRQTLGASHDILLRARAAGGGDVNAWSNQGLFPVHTDNSFEYAIEKSGFDDGWEIYVIGYFP